MGDSIAPNKIVWNANASWLSMLHMLSVSSTVWCTYSSAELHITAVLHSVLNAVLYHVLTAVLYCVLTAVLYCVLTAVLHCVLTAVLYCVLTAGF